MKKIVLTDIRFDYHRNGITGEGFHVATFNYEKRKMMAILFGEQGQCAVLDVDMLAEGNIAFASNSWRGDHFEDILRKFIESHH